MTKQTFLAWLVIIRRDDERRICPQLLRALRRFDRIASRIRSCAGPNVTTLSRDLCRQRNDGFTFLMR